MSNEGHGLTKTLKLSQDPEVAEVNSVLACWSMLKFLRVTPSCCGVSVLKKDLSSCSRCAFDR